MELVYILLAVFVIYMLMNKGENKGNMRKDETIKAEEKLPYYKNKYLLTKAENNFYQSLKIALSDGDYYICQKTRVADILSIGKSEKRQAYFNKIKAKHIDFLICKDDLYFNPILAIELDDSSHNEKNRVERDDFINKVFEVANLPLYRVKASNSYQPNKLRKEIFAMLGVDKKDVIIKTTKKIDSKGGKEKIKDKSINTKEAILEMPQSIMGKSIHRKVIPTVYNLKNMLFKLKDLSGDVSQLESWEKRSYMAYNIDDIKMDILKADENNWPGMVREHILTGDKSKFGASCVDVYLVGYVAHEHGVGKDVFGEYIRNNDITDKDNSIKAIWSVGKGDGVYLGVLNNDGSIKDREFFEEWIKR